MANERTRALSEVLDQLESVAHDDSIKVGEVVQHLGRKSSASLMLIFALISTSPASGIPGITAIVAFLIFILTVQLILGRKCVWLPDFVARRSMSTEKLCKGVSWLRRPVRFIERFLRPRLGILLHRPWILFPLVLILALTLAMPLLEVIPTSGSIASAVIALFAAGLLTRDGALVLISFALLMLLPLAVWQFGFTA